MGRVFDWLIGADLPASTTDQAPVEASAGRVALATRGRNRGANVGWQMPWVPDVLLPVEYNGAGSPWLDRAAAMSLPTISRCRDLICSAVGALPFTLWQADLTRVPVVEQQIPPAGWMDRPDPNRTRQWLLSWTVDDLMFYEQAHWLIVKRYARPNDYPATFARIAPGDLNVGTDGRVQATVNGVLLEDIDPRDIVEFLSPIEGLLSNGWRAISIALQLDASADRFASAEIPAGVLEEQEGSEDLTADELAEIAETFSLARLQNTTAATNKYVKYQPIDIDASKMQIVEGRTYQALELSRLGNTPPYLVGAPAGTGMTYQNGQQARADLIDFGAMPYIGCIEQTLSGPNVTPRGQAVRLDANAWLRNPLSNEAEASPNDLQVADPTNPDGATP